jgi:gas vesicle protein
MADHNKKKPDKRKSGIDPVAAAVTGAIVGAGVAVAGAVALKDKKNREKVKQVLNNVKDQAVGYMEKMQKDVKSKKSGVENKLDDGQKEVKKVTSSTK